MAADEKWYFTKEQLLQSPSRKSGYDVDKELSSRQQAANFIQDMGQRLQVSQLCINTAIVYMHRFYVFHSLASFHRNAIAAAALFLAAKVEEQPRKLEHVIKVAHICLHKENPNLDTKSEVYLEQAQDLVFNENVLLQTLGFDVAIDHPHTHVVRCCQLVRASKDLAQTSYFMASNSLHLTTMCLQYKPTVVACFCIHLACKWSNWEIPRSNEGKDWFWYVDKTVTLELLEQLTGEFLVIFDKCPTKLKRKMMSMNQNNSPGFSQQSIPHDGLQFASNFEEPRKLSGAESVKPPEGLLPLKKQSSQLPNEKPSASSSSTSTSSSASLASHSHHQKIDYREYREKKERERLEREKQQHHHHHQQPRDSHGNLPSNSHHHSKGGPVSTKGPSSVQSRSSSSSSSHKGYQQQSHMQQSIHFQNPKENVDGSGGQNFQSRDSKDNNYLKQHPPHTERDNTKDVNYHGQYGQSSNQHQNYSHKPESNFAHRDGSRTNHAAQISGNSNLAQSLHHSSHSSNPNFLSSQREFGNVSQRDNAGSKGNSEIQVQPKKDISSSIRDIIGQSLPQTDSHSMTNDRKDARDKARANYMHGSGSLANNRPEMVKNGRDQMGKVYSELSDKKVDDFSSRSKEKMFKKDESDPVIETMKLEAVAPVKTEKSDESDSLENYSNTANLSSNSWNYDFGLNVLHVKSEKKDLPVSNKLDASSVKSDINVDKSDSSKSNMFSIEADSNTPKSQAVHTIRGVPDSKYKSHHYVSGNKNSEINQFKNEKISAQCSSDLPKKINDRLHEKIKKSESDRISHIPEISPASDSTKHHKLHKEMPEKHKLLLPGQQHMDPKMKDRSSPSKYTKIKTLPRNSNSDYIKSDYGHFGAETNISSSGCESDRNEKTLSSTVKTSISDDSIKTGSNIGNLSKHQKGHEYGTMASLAGSVPESNLTKSSKTSSIFSPDSKIPPQNIFNSLEKDSKKSMPSTHRTHTIGKISPASTPVNIKSNVPAPCPSISNPSTVSTGSLFSPPLPKPIQPVASRHRTSSSGSEPELIPVLTKIEETPGYENIIREKKIAIPISGKSQTVDSKDNKSAANERTDNVSSLFDFEPKVVSKDKSMDSKSAMGRSDTSQFTSVKQTTPVKLSNEIRSDLGAVIYPNNPKSVSVSKTGQNFSLSEQKLSLANSVSTVNLSGIEKMVDTSISPAKPTSAYSAPSALKPNLAMNMNFNLPVSTGATTFSPSTGGQSTEQGEKLFVEQGATKVLANQELIDVEDISNSDNKKRSEKKKKKDKHKHKDKDKDKDKSERKKEKKKHKEKDKDKVKDKDKHKEKDRFKDKEKLKEKEIDVVSSDVINSEAPIKITIPKDKISGGLKIKISKDCLKKEGEVDSPKSSTSGELKIKITKDKFSHMGTYKEEPKGGSKKRERSPKASSDLPYPKMLKTSEKKISSSASRSNGTDGSSRNSNSHKHSVSENGSCIDISSLFDFPFDFEENGEGGIKTPDYDFEALNTSEYPQDLTNLPGVNDSTFKNSQNGCEDMHIDDPVSDDFDVRQTHLANIESSAPNRPRNAESHNFPSPNLCVTNEVVDDYHSLVEDISNAVDFSGKDSNKSSPLQCSPKISGMENVPDSGQNKIEINQGVTTKATVREDPNDCDILKNYKSILDSHSKRCDMPSLTTSIVPVGSPSGKEELKLNDTTSKLNRPDVPAELENPNYYNKYFKKDGNLRNRTREDKNVKARLDVKARFDDRPRYCEFSSHRYRPDYPDKRDDRRRYRDFREYSADSQYYFEGGDNRRFDYQKYMAGNFFNTSKTDILNYDINANENSSIYSQNKSAPQFMCDSSINQPSTLDINMQYHHYSFYNNYMYPSGSFRFYGNVPYVNISLIQQQPTPPGTGETSVHLGPPPLPLEPPPDLPPPPETPPPKQT